MVSVANTEDISFIPLYVHDFSVGNRDMIEQNIT